MAASSPPVSVPVVGGATFASLRLGRTGQCIVGRLFRFWDSRNVKKGGEFMENDMNHIFPIGVTGGGVGLLSKRRKAFPNIPAVYATNSAIVAACYCGARELVKVTRKSQDDDLMNSATAGLFSGALLGRLQAFDYATLRSKPLLERVRNMDSITLPVWFPIQILDEEALAKKKADEQKLFPRLNKEEPA